tara:strand:+ start:16902 stop:18062 length:1161 start_codon:yes stop_codon:yes gene_type:complete
MSGFVFSSDWHLSFGTWSSHPDLVGDPYYSLRQIVDFCIEHSCPLIGGGDLFDKPVPDPVSVSVMCREMDRMQEAGLPVYFVQGQHERIKRSVITHNSEDMGGTPEWMRVHPWPQHVHKKTFTIDGKQFYGLDWMPPGQIEEALAEIPEGTYFLVCHQVWFEFMGDSICQPECRLDMVPHVREVLTGDFHETTEADNGAYILMHSPGSISMRTMGEPADKNFFYFKGPDDVDMQAIEMAEQAHPKDIVSLKTRPYFETSIETAEDLDNFVSSWEVTMEEDLPAEIQKPMLRVNYHDDVPEVYDRILGAVGDTAYLFLYPRKIREDAIEIDDVTREQLRGQGLLGCLAQVEDESSPVYTSTARLLGSTDPAAELAAMHTEYLAEDTE